MKNRENLSSTSWDSLLNKKKDIMEAKIYSPVANLAEQAKNKEKNIEK